MPERSENRRLAEEFLDKIFRGTEHGDVDHRSWLKCELMKYSDELEWLLNRLSNRN